MKRIFLILLSALVLPGISLAQGVIKGQVIDQQSELGVPGANVIVVGSDPVIGGTTDLDGYFRIENVPLGRATVSISFLGYESQTIPNLEVTTGKALDLSIGLSESVKKLNEVVISGAVDKDQPINEMAVISARTFSVEEVNRFSGGRTDVARLASNFAGVSTPDDSRNDIVIRGNSPTGVLWRLEGIPIPSPNHFSTLGATGAPVSALNPNVLKNSDFMTSAFPSEYGNATAGVFDLGFRKGNRDEHEFMFQLGAFSGVELTAEGPLGSKGKGSYLIAGRYSFIGLMNSVIDIGTNATPDYRDIAFNFDFGQSKLGSFNLFGIGGSSSIDFLHDETDSTDLFAAEDEDLKPRSRFGVMGLRHTKIVGKGGYIRTILSAAGTAGEVTVDRYFNLDAEDEFTRRFFENDDNTYTYSLSSYWNKKFSPKLTLRTGFLLQQDNYDIYAAGADFGPDTDGDGIRELVTFYEFEESAILAQPFAQVQYKLSEKLTLNTGLHGLYLDINEEMAIEPRLSMQYRAAPKHSFNAGFGRHHQNVAIPILLAQSFDENGNTQLTNQNLDFVRSDHYVVGWDFKMGDNWRSKVEVYYQNISQAAVDGDSATSFSTLNEGADFGFSDQKYNLVSEGTGFNQGVEVTLEKFFSQGYYGLLTTSIYDSRYEGSDGIERNTAFNNGMIFNILGGKEFKIGKRKVNTFHIDTKFTWAGGAYVTPVDLEASRAAEAEVLDEANAFSIQQDNYLRFDLKFGLKINGKDKGIFHQVYLDLANVTNRENVFANRYNRLTNEVNTVYQTGFFPDLMYRIQF